MKVYGTLVKGLRVGMDMLTLLQSKEQEILSLSKIVNIPLERGISELLGQFEATVDSDFPTYQV